MERRHRTDPSWRVRFLTAVLACIALAAALLPLGCGGEKKTASKPPPVVSVITVARKDVPVTFEYVAQTQSSHLVNIHARVNGFLDKRMYTEGAVVKAGQVLFQMDPKPFKVQLDQMKAALVRQQAALEVARLNLSRNEQLLTQGFVSQKDLDDAVGAFQSTSAAVEMAKAQVETAKLNLSYTTIISPVTGISSFARQTDGTYINIQNSLLTTVAVLSPMWVNFSLSENQMQDYRNQVAKGLLRPPAGGNYTVDVLLVDGSVFPHKGQISFIEPSYNEQTGTFLIRADIDNPEGVLRPNQYVRARLSGAIRSNAILVPQRAVMEGSKGHFVWVVGKGNKVEQRPIEVGEWHGDNWFVFQGLSNGEQVVTDGGLALRPGMTVSTRPYRTAQGAGPASGG